MLGSRIWLSGVGKSRAEMRMALQAGVRFDLWTPRVTLEEGLREIGRHYGRLVT